MAVYELAYSPETTVTVAKLTSHMHFIAFMADTYVSADNTVCRGDTAYCEGMLTDGPDWMTSNPIAWAEVYLRVYNPDGSLLWEDWTLTSENGVWNFPWNVPIPTMTGNVLIEASWVGDETYDPSSASTTVISEARTPLLSLSIPVSGMPNTTVTWSGSIVDPKITTLGLTNRNIYLEQSIDGVTWTSVAGPVTTDASGVYSGSHTLPSPGTYYYRAYYPGGAGSQTYELGVSPTVQVEVTEVPPPPFPWWLAVIGIGAVGAGLYLATRK